MFTDDRLLGCPCITSSGRHVADQGHRKQKFVAVCLLYCLSAHLYVVYGVVYSLQE